MRYQQVHSFSFHFDNSDFPSSILYSTPSLRILRMFRACLEFRLIVIYMSSASFFTSAAFWIRALMSEANSLNISLTPSLHLALTSQQSIPCLLARAKPRSFEIFLGCSMQLSSSCSSSTSILLATSTFLTVSAALRFTCSIQFSMLRKDSQESTAQTRMIPAAPLQQVSVIVLKRSWPAVSQICILRRLLSTARILVLKSTPMVATWQSLKPPSSPSLLQKREIMFVFPTPVSPTMIILTMQSQMSRSFARLRSCSRSQSRRLSRRTPNSRFIFYRIQTSKICKQEAFFTRSNCLQIPFLLCFPWLFLVGFLCFGGRGRSFPVGPLQCWWCGIIIDITDPKMQQSQQLSSSASESKRSKHEQRIVIGYYNLRGKAQVCRLLCEYLGVDYKDKLFTLAEWQRFYPEKTRDWAFSGLPYLREGTFVVTQSVPMCVYVINRFGTPDLLGRTLRDKGVVEMYIWTIEYMGNVITINCQQKSPEELKRFKDVQWTEKVYPRLLKLEQAVVGEQWFLDYLTIIDFSIYELIRYMDCIFDNQTVSLPKLKRIQTAISHLPAIQQYEQSQRAIVEWCPTKLLEGIKTITGARPASTTTN